MIHLIKLNFWRVGTIWSFSLVLFPYCQNGDFLFTMMDQQTLTDSIRTCGPLVRNDWPWPDRNTAPILWAVHQKAGSADRNSINKGKIRLVPYLMLNRIGSLLLSLILSGPLIWDWRRHEHWKCHPPDGSLNCDDAHTESLPVTYGQRG